MRSLQVQVRSEVVAAVLEVATSHGARSPVALRAERVDPESGDPAAEWSIVLLALPNDRVGPFIDAVREMVDHAEFILLPVGALPLRTPMDRLDEQVSDVSRLSTLELVVASLQSVGAWAAWCSSPFSPASSAPTV